MSQDVFSLERYQEHGYDGPIRVFSEAEAASLRAKFFEELGQSEASPGPTKVRLSAWHQRLRWVYDMVTHDKILDMIEEVIGPNIVMWAVHFWYKEPKNGKYLPWHQDEAYWPMEPKKNVTCWIALGPTFEANGCLRVIPGTHREEWEHAAMNDAASAFGKGMKSDDVDESRAVSLEMNPGEVVIFNEKTVHGSNPNVSDIARVALSVRFTSPEVKFLTEQWTDVDRIKPYLVRGVDTHRLNEEIRGVAPAS